MSTGVVKIIIYTSIIYSEINICIERVWPLSTNNKTQLHKSILFYELIEIQNLHNVSINKRKIRDLK